MPAEVYTISGPSLGYTGDLRKIDQEQRQAAAPAAVTSAGTPAAQLQNALKALGDTQGDPQLQSVAVDGVIGPATVKALNYALANYIGGSPGFPRADVTVARARANAGALAALTIAAVKKAGGTVPPVVMGKKAAAPRVHAPSMPAPPPPNPSTAPPRWIWYAVGGFGVLVVLAATAKAIQKKRAAA